MSPTKLAPLGRNSHFEKLKNELQPEKTIIKHRSEIQTKTCCVSSGPPPSEKRLKSVMFSDKLWKVFHDRIRIHFVWYVFTYMNRLCFCRINVRKTYRSHLPYQLVFFRISSMDAMGVAFSYIQLQHAFWLLPSTGSLGLSKCGPRITKWTNVI